VRLPHIPCTFLAKLIPTLQSHQDRMQLPSGFTAITSSITRRSTSRQQTKVLQQLQLGERQLEGDKVPCIEGIAREVEEGEVGERVDIDFVLVHPEAEVEVAVSI
jgi:hypothetical protein